MNVDKLCFKVVTDRSGLQETIVLNILLNNDLTFLNFFFFSFDTWFEFRSNKFYHVSSLIRDNYL